MRIHKPFLLVLVLAGCLGYSVDAFGQELSLGVVVGAGLKDRIRPIPPNPGLVLSNPESGLLILGPTVEWKLSRSLSVEVEALARREKYTQSILWVNPETNQATTVTFSSTSTKWQFPLLVKYNLSLRTINPFVLAGPSFLPSQQAQYGISAGGGAEMNLGKLRIAPTMRYTRWADNQQRPGMLDQVEFLVGFRQPSNFTSPRGFGRRISMSAIAGVGLTRGFRSESYYEQGVPITTTQVESPHPVAGLRLEFDLGRSLFLELDGLYRPLRARSDGVTSGGRMVQSSNGFTVLTWEFPVLAKYKWSRHKVKPFVELGPTLRATGNLNGYDPSHYGITGGAGAEMHLRKIRVSPAIRYSHWQADPYPSGTIRNQAELIVGFSF
jgi:hypothetical protein